MPNLCSDKECTGCGACVNACNLNAIEFSVNEEGFYRPKIVEDKCVGCLKCERSCPVLHPIGNPNKEATAYAGWHKDKDVRAASSSGGAFSALAEKVLEEGGYVAGAAYGEDMVVRHEVINTKEGLKRLRQSKYVQSYVGNVFKQVKGLLDEGKKVMFVGTPCQCGGLKAFLGKEYEGLITVDFICHGVPSAKVFKRYLDWVEGKYGRKVRGVSFRDKRKGWYDTLRVIELADGEEVVMRGNDDWYWVPFNNLNNNLQESCYQCRFLGVPRSSDVTIADFWGIGKKERFGLKNEIEKGVSLLIANNERAKDFIASCERLNRFERKVEEATERNQAGLKSCVRPKERDTFYVDFERMESEEFKKTYLTPPLKTKGVKVFREYFPRWFTTLVRRLGQK